MGHSSGMLAFYRMFLVEIRDKIRDFFYARQVDILSAAMVLAGSVLASRILGLVRDRVLTHYFAGEQISLYFAAFRLPDTLFEILVFGTLSAAFIPTFVSYLSKKKEKEAWTVAGVMMNLSLVAFVAAGALVFFFAETLSRLLAPGFSPAEISLMAQLTRILLLTQVFFVLSFFLNGVLTSYQRFLIPAISPIFYNLGIIAGIVFFSGAAGIFAPAWGAVLGAFLHFAVPLPAAIRFGFRPIFSLDFTNPGVKKILHLAAPRAAELIALQVLKASDLFFASLIGTASYAYLTFAQHLEMIPVSLFGLSIAEASLPALSYRRGKSDFKRIFLITFRQIIFLTLPVAAAFVVLRIPLVRLAFGAPRFTWDSTVLTGYTLSAFAIGILGQAIALYFVRAFYALGNTMLPVTVGVADVFFNVALSAYFVLVLKLPVWGLALSFATAALVQAVVLGILLARRLKFSPVEFLAPLTQVGISAFASGAVMYTLLKILDRSAWDKNLFLGRLVPPVRWETFVLDTRYTLNLLTLTILVALVGLIVYLFVCRLVGVKELTIFNQIWHRLPRLGKVSVPPQIAEDEHLSHED